ncbi:Colicin V production protein [Buchnera aphidicola (Protaphis terricola)]
MLIDIIFFIIIFFSIFLGIYRGFLKELILIFFWFFLMSFFINYKYFSVFNSFIFLKNKKILIILNIIFLFILRIILNILVKKIIKKFKLSYANIILGGLFGLFRGLILIVIFLFFIDQCNHIFYLNLFKKSFLIHMLILLLLNNNFNILKYF